MTGVGERETAVTSLMTSSTTTGLPVMSGHLAVIIGVSVSGAVLLVIALVLLTVLVIYTCGRRDAHTQRTHQAWENDNHHVTCTDVTHQTGAHTHTR